MDFHSTMEILRGDMGEFLTSSVERLALAALLGGAIGLEREYRHKAAGLRTNMLICLGAALFTLLSIQLADMNGGDSTRIASQIIPGIGFIGAGSILRERGSVTGLTTAATIFVTASVGMAAGGGLYATAVFATVVILIALKALGRLEVHFAKRRRVVTYEVFGRETEPVVEEVSRILRDAQANMRDLHVASSEGKSRVVFSVAGVPPSGENSVTVKLHESSVFSSVQNLGSVEEE